MSFEVTAHSRRVSLLQPTAINSILAEVHQCREQGLEVLSLMRGEPDFATPRHIVEAADGSLKNGRTSYPDNRGEAPLREAVAEKLARDNQLHYDPGTEILVTSGATFGIYAALMATLDEGDEVLLPDPIYDAYQSPIRLAGGRPRPIAATISNGRFQISSEALNRAWNSRCKVLILNTPWNPVGTVFTSTELEELADFLGRRNLLLISDEIYEAITYDTALHLSPLFVARELRDRCILVNSLSKTYAMTGWRVGYCAGAAHWIDAMLLILQQSSRGPAMFVQDAAREALLGPQQCVAEMRVEYVRRRLQVVESLHGIPGCSALSPEGGFFSMIDVRRFPMSSDVVRRRLLREHGVALVHGAAYGAAGEGMLRVSFASGGENFKRALERLRKGLLAMG